jgi:hypothetical protein
VVGHQKEALEFTSRIERGCAVLTIERPTEGNSPLLRWPAIAGDGKVLTLAAMRDGAGGESWLETLATLSTSDWDLTAGLLRRMLYAVAAREVVVSEGEMPRQLEGLGVAVRAIDAVGPSLRFDTFQVTAESENSKRTVLALELSHLSLGGVRLPKLAFQLQAALETSGNIGNDFFLIFGRSTAARPFKTWVGNAKGAEGEDVMAVPFTSDPGSMGLWATLSQADRVFLRSLVKLLPACFRSLSPSGKQIKRPVDQWLSACERLSSINTEPKVALNAPAAATQDPPQGKTVKAKPPPARSQAGAKTAAKLATAAASVKPVAKSGKPVAKKAAR